MASPNLTTEVAARMQFPVEESERSYNVVAFQFEGGQSQVYKTNDTLLRAWVISYANQTEAEFAALRAFFDARKGPFETFYWNHPMTGEVDIKVRFDWEAKSFDWKWDSPTTRSVVVRLREVK